MDFGSDHDSVSQEKEKTFSTICDRKNNSFSFKIILFSFAKIKSFVPSSSSFIIVIWHHIILLYLKMIVFLFKLNSLR